MIPATGQVRQILAWRGIQFRVNHPNKPVESWDDHPSIESRAWVKDQQKHINQRGKTRQLIITLKCLKTEADNR